MVDLPSFLLAEWAVEQSFNEVQTKTGVDGHKYKRQCSLSVSNNSRQASFLLITTGKNSQTSLSLTPPIFLHLHSPDFSFDVCLNHQLFFGLLLENILINPLLGSMPPVLGLCLPNPAPSQVSTAKCSWRVFPCAIIVIQKHIYPINNDLKGETVEKCWNVRPKWKPKPPLPANICVHVYTLFQNER